MDLAALKSEITTDPATLGYAGKSDEAVADLLNVPNRTPDAVTVDTGTLRACFIAADWAGLQAAQKERINFLLGSPTLDVPAHIRLELRLCFRVETRRGKT